jgi:hypothetical protein
VQYFLTVSGERDEHVPCVVLKADLYDAELLVHMLGLELASTRRLMCL